jgi:hypothetical protein
MALPIRHPAGGLLPRIAVEDAELARVLGDQYRSYQKATHRLVPAGSRRRLYGGRAAGMASWYP